MSGQAKLIRAGLGARKMDEREGNKSPFSAIFGRTVALLRRELGLSQTKLGMHLGTDRHRVARVEVGRNVVTLDDVMGLEAVFRDHGLPAEPGTLVRVVADVTGALERRGTRVEAGKPKTGGGGEMGRGLALDWEILSALRLNGCCLKGDAAEESENEGLDAEFGK